MVVVKRRPPGRPTRGTSETGNKRATHAGGYQAGRRRGPRIRWVKTERTGIIPLERGRDHVLVWRHSVKHFAVYHLHDLGGFAERAASFATWREAKMYAEDLARRIGVDGLAFEGKWRSKPATEPQIQALLRYNITFEQPITIGEAGNLMLRSIARNFNPHLVAE